MKKRIVTLTSNRGKKSAGITSGRRAAALLWRAPLLVMLFQGGLWADTAINILPGEVSLTPSQTQKFAAFSAGVRQAGVIWSLDPAVGSITNNGVYTAPAVLAGPVRVAITATMASNPAVTSTTFADLNAVSGITLNSSTQVLTPSQSQTLSASVAGGGAVHWSLNPQVGTLSIVGNSATYTAPAIINSQQVIAATATSMVNPSKTASVFITLLPMVSVALGQSNVTLGPSGTQQFTAQVTGTADTGVIWSVQPPVGTIDQMGFYKAPPAIQGSQSLTVIGTSEADATKSGRGRINLNPGVQFTMNGTGLASLTYNGQNMLFANHGNPYFVQVSQVNAAGNPITASVTPTSVVANNATSTITQTYSWGVATTSYQASGGKLLLTVNIQNNSPNTISRFWMFPLAVQLPAAPISPAVSAAFNVDAPSSIWWNYGSGAVDLANDDVVNPLALAFWQADNSGTTKWYVMLETDLPGKPLNPGWASANRPIAPGASDTYTVSLRFGQPGSDEPTLASDVFARYAAAHPRVVATPSPKKPIASLFLSGRFRPTFAKNPRGWFNDSTLDITTPAGVAAFQRRMMSWAAGAVAEMQHVGAMGGIIWDIEGQQFDEAYIGDPTQAEAIAPELVGVLDAFIGTFTSAGLRIGFTLRPQSFSQQLGTVNVAGNQVSWVSGTQFDPSWSAVVDGGTIVLGGANYVVKSVQSATSLTLASVTAVGNAMNVPYVFAKQTNTADPGAVLMAKAQYAVSRWGPLVSLFYVDSNVAWDGEITPAAAFQNLTNAFPGLLVFPEWSNTLHYAYGLPYRDATRGLTQPPAIVTDVYPNAAGLISVPGDENIAASQAALTNAVRSGSILLFGGWYDHPGNDVVKQIYATVGN